MIANYVVDTHALYWYFTGHKNLSPKAKRVFQRAAQGEVTLWIPTIVLAEIYYLLAKQKKDYLYSELFSHLQDTAQFNFGHFEAKDILSFAEFASIPEMHDRIIAVLSNNLSATCITKDKEMMQSDLLRTLW